MDEQSDKQEPSLGPDTTLIEEPKEWQFKVGGFLIRNKVLFKRMFYFILFFVDLIVLSNLGLKWVDYQAGQRAHQEIVRLIGVDLIDYRSFREKNTPKTIQVITIQTIEAGQGNYDLVARISNPNQDWLADKVAYRFRVDDQVTAPRQTYILPGQNKLVSSFNFTKSSSPNDMQLDITEVNWEKAWDVSAKTSIYSQIEISDVLYTPNLGDQSQVDWRVDNKSAYNFWSIDFQIVLFDALDEIIGVNHYTGEKIRSLDTKNYSATWFGKLPAVRKVEVIPEVNVFDDRVYMPIDY